MYLIDTSIWIPFFASERSAQAELLTTLLEDNNAVCINGLIEMEILMGIKSDKQATKVSGYLGDFQYFPDLNRRYLWKAMEIYRACRKKGVTIRKSADCLIAANALLDKLIVVHHDRDFDHIRKVFKSLQTLSP